MTGFFSAVDHEEQQHEEHHEVEDEDEHGPGRIRLHLATAAFPTSQGHLWQNLHGLDEDGAKKR